MFRWIPALLFSSLSLCAAERKPNVILFLTDDQGWGDAAAWGHPYVKTPNLDRLTAEGTRVSQFYVANPVCSPSRTAFTTGKYPARYGIHGHFAAAATNAARHMPNWLDDSAATLPDQLKTVGYKTAHFGKWHLGSGTGAPGIEAYGFDVSRTCVSNDPSMTEQAAKTEHWWGRSTEVIVNDAISFIRQNKGQPFYCNIWTLVPHAKLDPTPEQLAVYDDLLPKAEDPAFGKWAQDYYGKAKDLRQQMKVFLASLTDMDTQLGRLLAELKTLGIDQDTLLVFSSDNGPEDYRINNATNGGVGSPGPLRARKRSIYEGGVRVPFVARWPGKIPAGVWDQKAVMGAVDFLPTVCAIAGATLPEGVKLDGEDVSDILLQRTGRDRKGPLFWEWRSTVAGNPEYTPPPIAVRKGDWKLLTDKEQKRVELYNIPADPEERQNLAASQPEVTAELAKLALAWKSELPAGEEGPVVATGKKKGKAAPNQRELWWAGKDRDKDGQLTREEYLANFPDKAEGERRFPLFDRDKNGVLSKAEFMTPVTP
jgi:arylsulfatase A-like enzyme